MIKEKKSCWVILILVIVFLFPLSLQAEKKAKIRVALDDLPGIDMLIVLVAFERARERGLDIEISYLQSEGIASQAVANGQADIGMGTPYRWIQKSNAPIRMFFQLNTLRFHPVVNTDYLKEWKDLDGIVMYTHGPGSGTEAIMNMLAKRNGISYKQMKYIPGSGVRARAMLKRQMKATIVDTERRNILLNSKKGNFKVLPMTEINASDEALFANQNYINENMDTITILIEELLYVWNKTIQSPEYLIEARKKYNLLPNLSNEKTGKILGFYTEMVEVNAFPNDGGSSEAFSADIAFYIFSGTIKGEKSSFKESDFWNFEPLRMVLSKQKK